MKLEKNNLRLIVMDNCLEFGKKVDENLKKMYRDYKHIFKTRDEYITEKKELKKLFKKI